MKFLVEIDKDEIVNQILADYEGDESITCEEDISEAEIYEYICGVIGAAHSSYNVEILDCN
jgi:hypothetical protein